MNITTNRRRIIWSEITKSPRNWLALLGATFFGSGLLPKAPGTWGTIAAAPIWFGTSELPLKVRGLIWLTLAIWGVWSAKVFDQVNGTQDNQNIVMDEVTGLGITAWTAGIHPINYAIAVILFRFFDIVKPFPVRLVDRLSHRSRNRLISALGVMGDDWVAGAQGLLMMMIAQHLGWLAK